MFDYRITVVAPLSYREPLAYSIAPRTVPTLVSRSTNPRPPVQNGTTPMPVAARLLASKPFLFLDHDHVSEAFASNGSDQTFDMVLMRLGLELHPEKTRIVDLSRWRAGFDFLRCHLRKRRTPDGRFVRRQSGA